MYCSRCHKTPSELKLREPSEPAASAEIILYCEPCWQMSHFFDNFPSSQMDSGIGVAPPASAAGAGAGALLPPAHYQGVLPPSLDSPVAVASDGYESRYPKLRTTDSLYTLINARRVGMPSAAKLLEKKLGSQIIYWGGQFFYNLGGVIYKQASGTGQAAQPFNAHPKGVPIQTMIAADSGRLFFMAADHTVTGLGSNQQGELGLGHQRSIDIPTLIPLEQPIDSVVMDGYNTYFWNTAGAIYVVAWNSVYLSNMRMMAPNLPLRAADDEGRLRRMLPRFQFRLHLLQSHNHLLFLCTESEGVYVYPSPYYREIPGLEPRRLPTIPANEKIIATQTIPIENTGRHLIFFLSDKGNVYAAIFPAKNLFSEQALRDALLNIRPIRVRFPPDVSITSVAHMINPSHLAFISTTGSVYYWALSEENLAVDNIAPAPFLPLQGILVKKITAVSERQIFCLTLTGEVYAWGRNGNASLGVNALPNSLVEAPLKVNLPPGVRVHSVVSTMLYTFFVVEGSQEIYGCGCDMERNGSTFNISPERWRILSENGYHLLTPHLTGYSCRAP
jgi:alpha-tubulin suppressor-like RCC1 family protein